MDDRLQKAPLSQTEQCVCIVAPYMPVLSETFISGHIERLPAKTILVHGWPPSVGSKPVLSTVARIGHKVRCGLSGLGVEEETTASYLAAFRRFRPDAVLAEYGPTGVSTMRACLQLNIPLVVHFHGYDASVHEVLEENAHTYPVMFRAASALIAVSRAMERKLISLGAPPAKVYYNPYGINCDNFRGSDPSNAPPVFLAVGRFVEKKSPHNTLKAFASVHRSVPEARLRMIGDGRLLDQSRALAEELHVQDAVTFLGAQPPDVVQEEMRTVRCFVQHSMMAANGDCEGTPLGILEAGASGLPVVSTRHAGIPDVVIEGETGFLVDEGDVDGMAENMLRLAQNPELARSLGRNARKRMESHFSEERSNRRLWEIIESCIVIAQNRSELKPAPTT